MVALEYVAVAKDCMNNIWGFLDREQMSQDNTNFLMAFQIFEATKNSKRWISTFSWIQSFSQMKNHDELEEHESKLVHLEYTIIFQKKVDYLQI